MNKLRLIAFLALAAMPSAIAMLRGFLAPPGYESLTGFLTVSLSFVFLLAFWFKRINLQRFTSVEMTRLLLGAGAVSLILVAGYLTLYSYTVVERPFASGHKMLLPIVPKGELAEMIQNAGGRQGAVDHYGTAAVAEAARESNLSTTVFLLVTTYSIALASVFCTLSIVGLFLAQDGSKRSSYTVVYKDKGGDIEAVKVRTDDAESIGHFLEDIKNRE